MLYFYSVLETANIEQKIKKQNNIHADWSVYEMSIQIIAN